MKRQPAVDRVERVQRVCAHIDANLEAPLNLHALAALAGFSPKHFLRVFQRVTGVSPRQYVDACRLARLKSGLKEKQTVTTAMLEAGYGSSSRLYERAASQLGMTPRAYQKGAPALRVRFTIADCALGRLLLAATELGICALSLGDSDDELESFVRAEFPAATLSRADDDLRPWLQTTLDHLQGKLPHLDLPLDVRATAFQRRVWQALQTIPRGETRTYAQIAAQIGEPKAVRAVARACATNPASVVIPCHRVVRTDGKLGGYRWGLDRKRKLLAKEQE